MNELLTRRQLTVEMKKLSKKFDFDYYTENDECCNSCFSYKLPIDRKYVYLKYFPKGMNYTSIEKFMKYDEWFLAYGGFDKDMEMFQKVFKELYMNLIYKKLIKDIIIPEDFSKCIAIIRFKKEE